MATRRYRESITATVNRKGVLDIDTVKGCAIGMAQHPGGGCYGLCYAAKMADLYGYDFASSVSRAIRDENPKQMELFDGRLRGGPKTVFRMVKNHSLDWFRIGTMGDPSHDWELTVDLCEWLGGLRTPVIVTKHWKAIPDTLLKRMNAIGAVMNTSISPLDTMEERNQRLQQFRRVQKTGMKSVLRIVSCRFGDTEKGRRLSAIQDRLFQNCPVIDNPLRIPQRDQRVDCGHIRVEKIRDMNQETYVSRNNENTYIGHCSGCPDQCGVV